MSGYNLPPGVTESMIPGNRPEDELAERLAEGWRPRCGCGAFVPVDPPIITRVDDDKYRTEYEIAVCKNCGHEEVLFAGPTIDPDGEEL